MTRQNRECESVVDLSIAGVFMDDEWGGNRNTWPMVSNGKRITGGCMTNEWTCGMQKQ
jgi:hypothetical protein